MTFLFCCCRAVLSADDRRARQTRRSGHIHGEFAVWLDRDRLVCCAAVGLCIGAAHLHRAGPGGQFAYFCRCGALEPVGAHFCWACGKASLNFCLRVFE